MYILYIIIVNARNYNKHSIEKVFKEPKLPNYNLILEN